MSITQRILFERIIFGLVVSGISWSMYGANLNLDNNSTKISMSGTNARIRLGNVSKVYGWSEQSIIKKSVGSPASSWAEAYSNGVVIGNGALAPATDLLISTSCAVVHDNSMVERNASDINDIMGDLENNVYGFAYNRDLLRVRRTLDYYVKPLLRQTSNAMNYYAPIIRNNSNLLKATSDAVVSLSRGIGNIVVEAYYQASCDVWLSDRTTLEFTGGGSSFLNSIYDGNGYSVRFPRGQINRIIVAPGVHALFTNVVLRDFDDTSITLGEGASLTFGNGTVLELGTDQAVHRILPFIGRVTIQGFNNRLSFADQDSGIQVLPSSTVAIQNTIISGLQGNNVFCVDDSATMLLSNSDLVLSNDYIFPAGALIFDQTVNVKGSFFFSYESSMQSMIAPQSVLFFDNGTKFYYAPGSAHRDLIGMADKTSTLELDGCDVFSTPTGLRLTKGRLIIHNNNNFYANGQTLSNAIAFGNGHVEDNLTIDIRPDASIVGRSGWLDYANTNNV